MQSPCSSACEFRTFRFFYTKKKTIRETQHIGFAFDSAERAARRFRGRQDVRHAPFSESIFASFHTGDASSIAQRCSCLSIVPHGSTQWPTKRQQNSGHIPNLGFHVLVSDPNNPDYRRACSCRLQFLDAILDILLGSRT